MNEWVKIMALLLFVCGMFYGLVKFDNYIKDFSIMSSGECWDSCIEIGLLPNSYISDGMSEGTCSCKYPESDGCLTLNYKGDGSYCIDSKRLEGDER